MTSYSFFLGTLKLRTLTKSWSLNINKEVSVMNQDVTDYKYINFITFITKKPTLKILVEDRLVVSGLIKCFVLRL